VANQNPRSLPILVQPDFIRKALSAGKHVLSEKPIAKDIATARDLLQWYHANIDTSKTVWAVAENFRYMTKFLRTAEEVQKLGRVKNFRVNSHALISTDSKYFSKLITSLYVLLHLVRGLTKQKPHGAKHPDTRADLSSTAVSI
jgi:glucose-fructose oxidoreductase